MFDKKKYINNFIKENYRTIKVRIRHDNKLLINKLNSVDNINKYISDLIYKDILDNREYNFINNSIEIDFELSTTMLDLIQKAEEADILDDYGLYMNIAYAIDSQAKKETSNHILRESEWNKLIRRYCL